MSQPHAHHNGGALAIGGPAVVQPSMAPVPRLDELVRPQAVAASAPTLAEAAAVLSYSFSSNGAAIGLAPHALALVTRSVPLSHGDPEGLMADLAAEEAASPVTPRAHSPCIRALLPLPPCRRSTPPKPAKARARGPVGRRYSRCARALERDTGCSIARLTWMREIQRVKACSDHTGEKKPAAATTVATTTAAAAAAAAAS